MKITELNDTEVTEAIANVRALVKHHGSVPAAALAMRVSTQNIYNLMSPSVRARPGRRLADAARIALDAATAPVPDTSPRPETIRPPRVVVAMPTRTTTSEPSRIDRMLEELTAEKQDLAAKQHALSLQLAEVNRIINALLPAASKAVGS